MTARNFSILACLLLGWPAGAHAQFRVMNNNFAPGRTQAVVRPVAVARPAFNYNPYAYGYNPYGGADPYGGYMRGAADLVNAQGQYLIQTQQAYLSAEEVKRSKVDTKRKVFDEYLYEKANTPTLEQQRETERFAEVARSNNNPPLTEIWSGKALNDLLVNIQTMESHSGARGPSVPVDYDWLKEINFTTGRLENTSVTMLSDGGKVDWLPVLQRDTFDKQRKEIDKLAPQVVQQVASGKTDIKSLDALNKSVKGLRQQLKDVVADMGSTDYISALRFVNQLQDSVTVMYQPNAASYFNNKWSPQGVQTVGDLVDQMTRNGLRFSAASSGDENFYTALHRAMVNYNTALARLAR